MTASPAGGGRHRTAHRRDRRGSLRARVDASAGAPRALGRCFDPPRWSRGTRYVRCRHRARRGRSPTPARPPRPRVRRLVEPQDPRDHVPDLRLLGVAVSGDRRLDLARRVQTDGEPALGGRARASPMPAPSHHRAEVLLGEHRSTAIAFGRCSSSARAMPRATASSRCSSAMSGWVRRRRRGRASPTVGCDIDAPTPHRVSRDRPRDAQHGSDTSVHVLKARAVSRSSSSSSACTSAEISKLL